MKIIIIDDEPKARNGLCKIISSHPGWEIINSFDDPIIALNYLKNNTVDIVITDIRMPQKNGLDLISELKAICPRTAFIILSGYSLFEYAQRSIDLGVRKFLVKPVSPQEVIASLSKIEDEIVSPHSSQNDSVVKQSIDTKNLIIRRAIEYLNLHYHQKLSLKDVASQLYISPNYLSNLFKKETGLNFSSYLMNIRLEKSLTYLRDLTYRISDIAELCGFTDYRYYCMSFHKKYKMTPLEYRNKIK